MAIYLVQHGRSLPKDQDPEKGLSDQGVKETEQIARVAAGYNVGLNQIFHSGKKRAFQTADIFYRYLSPVKGIARADGLKPLDDVTPWVRQLASNAGLMLVGHLPFMEKLTGLLTTGYDDVAPFKFQNSGIVCLSPFLEGDKWFIKWSLSPNIG